MSKHTRGPWKYIHLGFVLGPDGKPLARPLGEHADCDDKCEVCANGRLIAASEELLEACKRNLGLCFEVEQDGSPGCDPDQPCGPCMARTAIAKAAEGGGD